MKEEAASTAILQINADEAFIPVVSLFAEKMAVALGLGSTEALGLSLAVEEVYGHLCRVVLPQGGRVEVRCVGGGYYVKVDFSFPSFEFNMRLFNITATVTPGEDVDIEELGLLLASRSVDRFRASWLKGQGLTLSLTKEKSYPTEQATGAAPVGPLTQFCIRKPDSEELKLFASLVNQVYRGHVLPSFFSTPGKLVDMVAAGRYHASVAVGPEGEVGGGAIWHVTAGKAVEWFGPYLFDQKPDSGIGHALFESCIAAIARTPAVVLINRFPTPELPRESFECLGATLDCSQDGSCSHMEAWARLVHEDLGTVAWVHPQLRSFLQKEYERLALPREIRHVESRGELKARHSALLTTLNRVYGSATLRPVLFGEDFEKNLLQHIDLFRHEGIPNIFFMMDLGESWQADFAPGLLHNGFRPCGILPYLGAGDLVIFQLVESAP